jgi:hypothetical protein
MHAICPTHTVFSDLIVIVTCLVKYKSRSSSLRNCLCSPFPPGVPPYPHSQHLQSVFHPHCKTKFYTHTKQQTSEPFCVFQCYIFTAVFGASCCVVRRVVADVSKYCRASIFRAKLSVTTDHHRQALGKGKCELRRSWGKAFVHLLCETGRQDSATGR